LAGVACSLGQCDRLGSWQLLDWLCLRLLDGFIIPIGSTNLALSDWCPLSRRRRQPCGASEVISNARSDPDLMSSDRLPRHRHLWIYTAVSVKRSKPTNGRIVRTKSSKAHDAAWSRRSETSRQPPPICNPLKQNVENIPTKREIIRVIPRPLKPGHQPSLLRRNVRQPIIRTELQQLSRLSAATEY
jgi:hypothetical protein